MRLFIFLLCLMMFGCGLLEQSREPNHYIKLRKDNKDPLHEFSCGPQALQKAFKRLGIKVSLEELSHSIQKSHQFNTCIRDILSVFANDARRITFPEEIFSELKKRGYVVKKIKNYSELDKDSDVALILIKEKDALNYHWMCFPADRNILSFFGDNTILKEIYLIVK